MNLQPSRKSRVKRRGSCNDSEGAVLKPKKCDSSIFSLDGCVHLSLCKAENRLNGSYQVLEEIDGMNRLIDQGSSTIKRKRPSPLSSFIVLGRAIPLHIGVTHDQSPQPSPIDCFFENLNCW